MTLYLYVFRRFLLTFLAIFGLLACFYALIEMVDITRRMAGAELTFLNITELTILRLPEGLYDLIPLVVILASVVLFLALSRSSEMVIVRSAGRSALRLLLAPVACALLIGLTALSVMNPIVAATKVQYELRAADHKNAGRSVLSIGRDGLWLRQGGKAGQVVIHARRTNAQGTRFFDVTFIGLDESDAAISRTKARSATLGEGQWRLSQAKRWDLSPGVDVETTAQDFDELDIATSLTLEQIRDGLGAPATVSIWDLSEFIAQLKNSGFSARRHQVWLQSELSQPLMLVGMVLIGAALTMRHGRFGQTGPRVLLAIGLGFGFYFIRNLAKVMGENGHIPIAAASWLPPMAVILFAVGIILHLEDG